MAQASVVVRGCQPNGCNTSVVVQTAYTAYKIRVHEHVQKINELQHQYKHRLLHQSSSSCRRYLTAVYLPTVAVTIVFTHVIMLTSPDHYFGDRPLENLGHGLWTRRRSSCQRNSRPRRHRELNNQTRSHGDKDGYPLQQCSVHTVHMSAAVLSAPCS